MNSKLSPKSRWEAESKKYSCPHLRLRQVASIVHSISPGRMLDIGCAEGYLGRLCAPVTYYGCDFVHPVGEVGFVFEQCDFTRHRLPFAGEKFDVVTCSGILEYVEDLNSFFVQIKDRLIPNGHLILTYFNTRHISRRIQGASAYVHPDWRSNYSLAGLSALIRSNQIEITNSYVLKHGISGPVGVDKTTEWPIALPRLRWYSDLFAHQFILKCRAN